MILEDLNPEEFVDKQVKEIRGVLGAERALIAVSGGVDSSTCAALVHRAVGNNLVCVMIDDAFMREGEPERVAQLLIKPPINLPLKILNVQRLFLNEMKGLRDAEEKRKVFRETFYRVLSETSKREGCKFLVQGTILADIVETAGGVKTQHNVLSQIGIDPKEHFGFNIIEPLRTLLKSQVRQVARYLGMPKELSERQPFPGPGLSVRVLGEIREEKLESLKKATTIAESKLVKYSPNQYFAAIFDNKEKTYYANLVKIQKTTANFLNVNPSQVSVRIFEDKATGMKENKRQYGEIAALKVQSDSQFVSELPIRSLVAVQAKIIEENSSITRFLYTVHDVPQKRPYVVSIRAVETQDFLTANVATIPWMVLKEIAKEILVACPNVSSIFYDVTPKPPATIEME
jgi:GMP synthase (glutamine-hydrolysing)